MPIFRETKTIDCKGRVVIPPTLLKMVGLESGNEVYFETTKTGAIVIRKSNQGVAR